MPVTTKKKSAPTRTSGSQKSAKPAGPTLRVPAPTVPTTGQRRETDSMGEMFVPADALYGVQTARAMENFQISGTTLVDYPELINGFAQVKMAAAMANGAMVTGVTIAATAATGGATTGAGAMAAGTAGIAMISAAGTIAGAATGAMTGTASAAATASSSTRAPISRPIARTATAG